jgi:ferritin
MLISQTLNDALNKQIGIEFFADFQYLAMAVYFEEHGLSNLGNFFRAQASEERGHGLKILNFIIEAGGKAVVPAVEQPKSAFASAEEAARLFLSQEQGVTRNFYHMYEQALTEKDYATHIFLQWFVQEQIEEESTASKLLELIQSGGEAGIFQVEMMVGSWGSSKQSTQSPD